MEELGGVLCPATDRYSCLMMWQYQYHTCCLHYLTISESAYTSKKENFMNSNISYCTNTYNTKLKDNGFCK